MEKLLILTILLLLPEHSDSSEGHASTFGHAIERKQSLPSDNSSKKNQRKNSQIVMNSSSKKQPNSIKKDSTLIKHNSNKMKLLFIFSSGT